MVKFGLQKSVSCCVEPNTENKASGSYPKDVVTCALLSGKSTTWGFRTTIRNNNVNRYIIEYSIVLFDVPGPHDFLFYNYMCILIK